VSFKTRMEDPVRHANYRFRSRVLGVFGGLQENTAVQQCQFTSRLLGLSVLTAILQADLGSAGTRPERLHSGFHWR